MTITFERPIGAHGDVKELEYISALHQTAATSLRPNGSIHAEDIAALLSSRCGIKVDEETIKKDLLVDLAGDLETDPNNILDLCQVVAILLIPHLTKTAASGDDENIHAIFGKVLEAIMTDVVDGERDKPQNLNRDLLRRILDSYGEVDVSDDLIDEMLVAAGGPAMDNVMLDVPTLMQALTGDCTKYDTDWDTRVSTHYQDVFASIEKDGNPGAVTIEDGNDEDPLAIKKDETRIVKQVFTAASVDTTADTFRSKSFTVILWVTLVITYICYVFNTNLEFTKVDCDNLSSFGCKVVNGITTWLVIFLQLSILGSAFIILCSAGNSLGQQKIVSIVGLAIGMITIFVTTMVPYFMTAKTEFFNTEKNDDIRTAYIASLLLGTVLFVMQFLQLLGVIFGVNAFKKYRCLDFCLTPGIMKMESRTKKAASHKVSRMVDNALVLHARSPSASNRRTFLASHGLALMNYQLQEGLTERVGGFLWSWQKIRDGTIFTEEGVWIHSRLVACVVAQLCVCLFILLFSALALKRLKVESAVDDVEGDDDVYGWEIAVGGTAGVVTGFLACLAIALVYIPSFISTVLQFRSGVISSLRDSDFLLYRFAIDQTTILFGSAFWGCVYTGFIGTVAVGGIAFLAVWHVTREVVLSILAQIIGIVVTILLKVVILLVLRRQFYAAFFRKRVAEANYTNVVLECWNLGLSTGFMLARTAKLLLITAFYIGRIDVPFLAPGVGMIGPVALDVYPISFRKDLLVHDAHRHPYMERLCTMYMMKLRFGDEFATRAGSCWRLLFVLVLMPWMRKYRIRLSVECLAIEIADLEAQLGDDNENEGLWKEPSTRVLATANTVQKLENLRNLKSMRDFDNITSREDLLDREVKILCSQIAQLEEHNKELQTKLKARSKKEKRRKSANDVRVGDVLQEEPKTELEIKQQQLTS